jgi:hypothetical protein
LAFPQDRYEAFSFAAGSWTVALGTRPCIGVFGSATDLAASFSYDNEHRWHSGQFRSDFASRRGYWNQFLITSQLKSPE